MYSLHISSRLALAILASLVLVFAAPHYALAQASSDVREVIRASLLQDPRTANLSQAELDAMVSILVAESEQKGLTAEQIQWKPSNSVSNSGASVYEEEACATWPPLCTFNAAFGFDDPNSLTPVILGVTSIGMVWILAEVLHIRSRKKESANA